MTIQFQVVAKSAVTAIPDGTGAFTGFSQKPAIDSAGNIAFVATGAATPSDAFQSGVYLANAANVLSRVVKRGMAAPGGGFFQTFYGAHCNDVAAGKVAFRANISPTLPTDIKLYSNAGGTLVPIPVATMGNPILDGATLAVRGTVAGAIKALRFPGGEVDPGTGFAVAQNTDVGISGTRTIFRRFSPSISDIAISTAGTLNSIARIGGPSPDGGTYSILGFHPMVDGPNAVFTCNTSKGIAVHKYVNGALVDVADNLTVAPGAGPLMFMLFDVSSIAIIGDAIAFGAKLNAGGKTGVWMELGGNLEPVLVSGNLIGAAVKSVFFSGRGVAVTARGIEMALSITYIDGSSALIRAIIPSDTPPPPPDPDYDVTVDGDSVTLFSTRGNVNTPTQDSPAEFTVDEPGGPRKVRVTVN